MMRRFGEVLVAVMVTFSIASMLSITACKGKDSGSSGASAPAGSASAPIVGASGAIGIKECDDYLAKVNACLEKDQAAREANEQQVKAQTENWKAMAASNKAAATTACKTALDNFALIFPTCK